MGFHQRMTLTIISTRCGRLLQESSIILTPEQIRQAKQLQEEERARVNAISNARKAKMQKVFEM